MKQSKFIKINFLLFIILIFFRSVNSVSLSRCSVFGLNLPASCELFRRFPVLVIA